MDELIEAVLGMVKGAVRGRAVGRVLPGASIETPEEVELWGLPAVTVTLADGTRLAIVVHVLHPTSTAS